MINSTELTMIAINYDLTRKQSCQTNSLKEVLAEADLNRDGNVSQFEFDMYNKKCAELERYMPIFNMLGYNPISEEKLQAQQFVRQNYNDLSKATGGYQADIIPGSIYSNTINNKINLNKIDELSGLDGDISNISSDDLQTATYQPPVQQIDQFNQFNQLFQFLMGFFMMLFNSQQTSNPYQQ